MFSYESTFYVSIDDDRGTVIRNKKEVFHPDCIEKTVKLNKKRVNIATIRSIFFAQQKQLYLNIICLIINIAFWKKDQYNILIINSKIYNISSVKLVNF